MNKHKDFSTSFVIELVDLGIVFDGMEELIEKLKIYPSANKYLNKKLHNLIYDKVDGVQGLRKCTNIWEIMTVDLLELWIREAIILGHFSNKQEIGHRQ